MRVLPLAHTPTNSVLSDKDVEVLTAARQATHNCISYKSNSIFCLPLHVLYEVLYVKNYMTRQDDSNAHNRQFDSGNLRYEICSCPSIN